MSIKESKKGSIMKLQTYQFGEVEFDDQLILSFQDGIVGFESLKKFVLLSQDDGLFQWLTSVDEPDIIFPLIQIRLLLNDFNDVEGSEAYGIIKFDKNPANITVNLKAPVYVNHAERSGFQKIFDTEKYPIDYKLFIEN
jgi:flagellar assembly factor FliW